MSAEADSGRRAPNLTEGWNALQGRRWEVLFDTVVRLRDIRLCKGIRESKGAPDEYVAPAEEHHANPGFNEISVAVDRDDAGGGKICVIKTEDDAVVIEGPDIDQAVVRSYRQSFVHGIVVVKGIDP